MQSPQELWAELGIYNEKIKKVSDRSQQQKPCNSNTRKSTITIQQPTLDN
jgi:hypothetical protein